MPEKLAESELVLNPDGSIYHLNLLPEDLADTVITVGDPDRVQEVSRYFDAIDIKKGKREFITHTGRIGNKRITVLSTGIGTDNIDIVLNELDALVNIDFEKRTVKSALKSLNIIRIGTTGSLQEDVATDSILISSYGLGLDALMNYYQGVAQVKNVEKLQEKLGGLLGSLPYYLYPADRDLLNKFSDQQQGITVTAPGFYGPQGRTLRALPCHPALFPTLTAFRYANLRITNLEMETAGIYALSAILGHKALSVNAVVANRITKEFSENPQKTILNTIKLVLSRLF